MRIDMTQVPLAEILSLREQYLVEMNCQVVHDSFHRRGFTDSYLLRVDGRTAGYGSIAGLPGHPRETVKEFYVLPEYRGSALPLFEALVDASGARIVEAQTNDRLLTLMLLDRARSIEPDKVLFADAFTTRLAGQGAVFRQVVDADQTRIFEHTREPAGDRVVEADGRVVATGGLMVHYNRPYADIYLEVAPDCRRRGFGSWLVQELKREAYETGRIPAARCAPENAASRAALAKAGMLPCARILIGRLRS